MTTPVAPGFLGEIPLWYHYLGIGLIFSGIWLTMKR